MHIMHTIGWVYPTKLIFYAEITKKIANFEVANITRMENQTHNNLNNAPQPDAALRGVKNIVFDLGGVVVDLCRENAVAALRALGLEEADSMLGLYRQEEPFLGLETGRVTAGEFFEIIRRRCPGASDVQITEAFNAFLVRLPVERLRRLRELRAAGYQVYALSNTNPVMYNSWLAHEFRQEGLQINDYFDGVVASFQELCCKPDLEIFRTMLRRYGLKPEETLMLDDSAANCEAAGRAGMRHLVVGAAPHSDMIAITNQLLPQ